MEPLAHYTVIRLKQDVLDNSNVGMIVTSTAKRGSAPAFTNGYDWNLKFDRNTYLLNGFLALSQSTNSNGERITGAAGKLAYSKIAGEHWLWTLSTDFTSNRYNINDVGFFFSPDDIGGIVSVTYKEDVPAAVVRSYNAGVFYHHRHIFEGANIIRAVTLSTNLLFSNYWSLSANGGADLGLYDSRETRGNGLYRKPVNYTSNVSLSSDQRGSIVLSLNQHFGWDEKQKSLVGGGIGVNLKPISWMEWNLSTDFQRIRLQEAWVDNIAASGTTESIFGDRNTDQANFTLRSTITFTRELTVQLYGQLFLAKGHYENLRRLVGTSDFAAPVPYNQNPDFNRQFFNTNVVLRWEYLPGSTLFLVWSQARSSRSGEYFSTFGNDFDATFQAAPANVMLLKVSYWWSV